VRDPSGMPGGQRIFVPSCVPLENRVVGESSRGTDNPSTRRGTLRQGQVGMFVLPRNVPWALVSRAKSNTGLSRAQFVPNMARNRGNSRLFVVSFFLCIQGDRLVRASPVSSSKLVMRVRFSSPAQQRKP
jgi:hypothetical protein